MSEQFATSPREYDGSMSQESTLIGDGLYLAEDPNNHTDEESTTQDTVHPLDAPISEQAKGFITIVSDVISLKIADELAHIDGMLQRAVPLPDPIIAVSIQRTAEIENERATALDNVLISMLGGPKLYELGVLQRE